MLGLFTIFGLLKIKYMANIQNPTREVWRNIPNYPNYQASNLGRVKSLRNAKRKTERIMSPLSHNTGYKFLWIFVDGKRVKKYVHRLILTAFVANLDSDPSVNHKNGVKTDNRLENLEWANWKEQGKHAYKLGLSKPKKGGESVLHKKVIRHDLSNNEIHVFNGLRDCGRKLQVSYARIKYAIENNIPLLDSMWQYA